VFAVAGAVAVLTLVAGLMLSGSVTSAQDQGGATPVAVGPSSSTVSDGSASGASGESSTGEATEEGTSEGGSAGGTEATFGETESEGETQDFSESTQQFSEANATSAVQSVDGEVEIAAEDFLLTVSVFDCPLAPGDGQSPADVGCSPVDGAVVVASDETGSIDEQLTNASGDAVLTIPQGQSGSVRFQQLSQTVTEGFVPAQAFVETTVESDSVVVLINIPETSTTDEPVEGRLQIASGQCFTLNEPRVEFIIVGPLARAASQECGPLPDASYVIEGGNLAEPLTLITDGSGDWRGALEIGDYTISRNGWSESFSVEEDATTVVVAIDFILGPQGTLTVERYVCTEGESNSIVFLIDPVAGTEFPNDSCAATNEHVEVMAAGSTADPLVMDLGDDGITTVDVAAGEYYAQTDAGSSGLFTVPDGGSVRVVIVEVRVTGSIVAMVGFCSDPISNFEDPTKADYWLTECTSHAAGTAATLFDGAGNVVSSATTGPDGGFAFEGLVPGSYRLTVDGMCAIFANGVDARGGFSVVAGKVVQVTGYGCAKPAVPDPPPGGGTGSPNPPGGGSGSIGDDSGPLLSVGGSTDGLAQPSESQRLYVTTLPSTGTANETDSALGHTWVQLLAAFALVLGAFVVGRRPLWVTLDR
jgi:hypothetical protein